MSKISATDLIKATDRLTVGSEFPLDNGRSPDSEARRIVDGRSLGVSDLVSEIIPALDETKAARAA